MKSLLANRFAPVTFSWGFLEKPLEELLEFQIKWTASLQQAKECKRFTADLPNGLEDLVPLGAANILYTSTKSGWTAVFQGCVGVTTPLSQISYPAEQLECRGLIVTCIEDTFDRRTKTGLYGGVSFEMFAPYRTSQLNYERIVSAIHDSSRWVFQDFGDPKDFEDTKAYSQRRVKDRLTDEILERYCAALGIDLFNPDFYGPDCGLVYSSDITSIAHDQTYHLAQARLGLNF